MRTKITVKGVVQGVGFRPYVFGLATGLNLRGYVANTSEGVSIDIEGDRVHDFIGRLAKDAPPLSDISEVTVLPMPHCGYPDFRIIKSAGEGEFTQVPPDTSVCNDCLRELFDPKDRRYLYPFINCTNCGPRYTITKSMPYDRQNTTMACFKMCPECRREYDDPIDRRFHAEPNACPVCGPLVRLEIYNGKLKKPHEGKNPLMAAAELLNEGRIIALKGLGGFHIACDATNTGAVKRLRERKRKSNKPFALMASDIKTIERFCELDSEEEAILQSNKRPIVLLRKLKGLALAEEIAPNNRYMGFMLPYTPLHYVLFYELENLNREGIVPPLVMTSGNMAEEPIVKDDEEAVERLSPIVDACLFHNRDIFMRADDSVVIVNRRGLQPQPQGSQPIRRSRGYVPQAIVLESDGMEVLGTGGELKNTFTVTKDRFAIPSQHIGDMENYETLVFFNECLENIKSIYGVKPAAIAHDLNPDYLLTKWAMNQKDIPRFPIQHHYAHIGSVMAEHGIKTRVIGVAFDGTGYGSDGSLWGGEFLIADVNGFERAGHLGYIPLPGGAMAVKEPWRTALGYIVDSTGKEALDYLKLLGFLDRYGEDNIKKLMKVIHDRTLSPLSSGAGRLFDAASAIAGICGINTFEGEAAMALESYADENVHERYHFDIRISKGIVLDFSLTIIGLIEDAINRTDKGRMAAKFHNTVAEAVTRVVIKLSRDYGLRGVALSGGTFQNMRLLDGILPALEDEGLNVFLNEKVPPNDAGISLGQAYIIRERLRERVK